MTATTIRYISFPKTDPPKIFVQSIVDIFSSHEKQISTIILDKGLTSNGVLVIIRNELVNLGFQVESGKAKAEKIQRPVFFGENGEPTLKYEIDAYHSEWRCGLEVEAGRAWMGNAIYRDLIQGLVMVQVDTLILAVPIKYKFKSSGRNVTSSDFDNTIRIAETLYSHSRVHLPYSLVVIGY